MNKINWVVLTEQSSYETCAYTLVVLNSQILILTDENVIFPD